MSASASRIALLARDGAGCEQPEVLELPGETRVDPGALAEVVEVELVLLAASDLRAGAYGRVRPGRASSCRITRSGRNSSRCSRRIVSSRSTSSSLKSR